MSPFFPEKLEMDETAVHPECLQSCPALCPQIFGKFIPEVETAVPAFVHHIHEIDDRHVAGLKQGNARAVDDGVIGVDRGSDVLLHDIDGIVLDPEEVLQLTVVLQPVGPRCSYAVVRLHDDRIADFLNKGLAGLDIVHHMEPRHGDPSETVSLFHLGLEFHTGHIFRLKTRTDVEILPQVGIPLQPVLVVGLQPVDPSVFMDVECHRAVDFIIILKRRDLVVLVEGLLQLPCEIIIGAVPDTQHVQAVLFQASAEIPVVVRKIR